MGFIRSDCVRIKDTYISGNYDDEKDKEREEILSIQKHDRHPGTVPQIKKFQEDEDQAHYKQASQPAKKRSWKVAGKTERREYIGYDKQYPCRKDQGEIVHQQ